MEGYSIFRGTRDGIKIVLGKLLTSQGWRTGNVYSFDYSFKQNMLFEKTELECRQIRRQMSKVKLSV